MKRCLLQEKTNTCVKNDAGRSSGSLHLLLLTIFGFFSLCVFAQQGITGKVVSGDSVIAGATVMVKGSPIATVTDANGKYSISAPANATLIVSFVGYAKQEVKPDNHTAVTVQLQSITQQVGEVMVVGYATQKKAMVTGSVIT